MATDTRQRSLLARGAPVPFQAVGQSTGSTERRTGKRQHRNAQRSLGTFPPRLFYEASHTNCIHITCTSEMRAIFTVQTMFGAGRLCKAAGDLSVCSGPSVVRGRVNICTSSSYILFLFQTSASRRVRIMVQGYFRLFSSRQGRTFDSNASDGDRSFNLAAGGSMDVNKSWRLSSLVIWGEIWPLFSLKIGAIGNKESIALPAALHLRRAPFLSHEFQSKN